jgi:transglutaminase-like putative cysteine protease
MEYKVTHATKYVYTESVPVCHNVVRLTPRETGGQRCRYHQIFTTPSPANRSKRIDYFGNPVDYFSIQEPHIGLTVTASSRVDVEPRPEMIPSETVAWQQIRDRLREDRSAEVLDAYQFVFDSPSIRSDPRLLEYAQPSFAEDRPILEAAIDLIGRIHGDFQYDSKATTVSTELLDVIQIRRGVCQDFAHVAIGSLRSLGLAARYVSGYLRTTPPPGKPRLIGADASHAWLSVYCGPGGWIDLDPTNNVLVGTDHITIAWGRDYSDVCPIQGVFVGGGSHSMSVSVDVVPVA